MKIAGHNMKFLDYLVLRTPPSHLGDETSPPEPGKVPKLSVFFSFLGILLGIVASFYITGLKPHQTKPAANQSVQTTKTPSTATSGPAEARPDMKEDARPFWKIFLISLVICGLTYQGLYFTLNLYAKQPSFLVIFVSFQYGYFWQSAVEGGRAFLT